MDSQYEALLSEGNLLAFKIHPQRNSYSRKPSYAAGLDRSRKQNYRCQEHFHVLLMQKSSLGFYEFMTRPLQMSCETSRHQIAPELETSCFSALSAI